MKTLRSFRRIIDRQTVLIVLLTEIATILCWRFGLRIQLPEGLIAIAIIFPLGFSINAAFARREKVLESYASLKATSVMLYLAHRDWLDPVRADVLERVRQSTRRALGGVDAYLRHPSPGHAQATPIYDAFADISGTAEPIRESGAYPADAARINRALASMMIDFERIRNVRTYRTPASLRAYSQVFLNLLPIGFAPHFAYLSDRHVLAVGLALGAVYATLLVSLDNIQETLEDPFDQLGEDDVTLDAVEYYDRTLASCATVGRTTTPQLQVHVV